MTKKNEDRIIGFEPLGLRRKKSQVVAQHILSAVRGHAVAVPDDASTIQKWQPLHSNLVSVGQSVLRAAGLSESQINAMREVHNPLDKRFYDGPDGRRFSFLLDGLEAVADVSEDMSKKYAPFFERNGRDGIFNGITVTRRR